MFWPGEIIVVVVVVAAVVVVGAVVVVLIGVVVVVVVAGVVFVVVVVPGAVTLPKYKVESWKSPSQATNGPPTSGWRGWALDTTTPFPEFWGEGCDL